MMRNLDEWRAAGFGSRHTDRVKDACGSMGEWGVAYFDRIPEEKITGALREVAVPGGTLVIHGPRGTGKTQFAAWMGMAMAARVAQDTERVLTQRYWSWPELMVAEKATFNRKVREGRLDRTDLSSPLEEARNVGLLVLDELQEGIASDFDRASLTRLIDYRYRFLLRTIVIANLQQQHFAEAVGPSVMSRLCETGAFLKIDCQPYR